MQKKILIVEKHDAVRIALNDWLGDAFPNHFIFCATSGEEAISIASATPPDLIIMDISLSGKKGIETARRIKKLRRSPKIIMLTPQADKIYQEIASKSGINECLPSYKILMTLIPAITKLLCDGSA